MLVLNLTFPQLWFLAKKAVNEQREQEGKSLTALWGVSPERGTFKLWHYKYQQFEIIWIFIKKNVSNLSIYDWIFPLSNYIFFRHEAAFCLLLQKDFFTFDYIAATFCLPNKGGFVPKSKRKHYINLWSQMKPVFQQGNSSLLWSADRKSSASSCPERLSEHA